MNPGSPRLATHLLLLTFCVRALVPAGYMPGDLDDGWHLKLCPDGLTQSSFTGLLGHQHDHEHSADSVSTCELSGFSAEPTTDCQTDSNTLQRVVQALQDIRPQTKFGETPKTHHSRAPPIF